MDSQPWFRRWFNRDYRMLYAHRDASQAEIQVEALFRENFLREGQRILDLGCGWGRHLKALSRRGCRPLGLDLSFDLLEDAANLSLPLVRSDMREIPFRDSSLDGVTSFFSSFGYFASHREDARVLREVHRVLKSGGKLFLDLLNKKYALDQLKSLREEGDLGEKGGIREEGNSPGRDGTREEAVRGATVTQTKSLKGNVIHKTIGIRQADGSLSTYREQLRLYSLAEMQSALQAAGFEVQRVTGTESGEAYHPEASPRMAMWAVRP